MAAGWIIATVSSDGVTQMSAEVAPATKGVDPAVILGSRLRRARLDADTTLRELARTLDVSPCSYPSWRMASHSRRRRRSTPWRTCSGTPGNRTRLVMDTGVIWEQLARNTDEHLDFMEITYPAGSSSTTDDRMLRHDGYEYGFLLEGELQVTVGFDEFTLKAGQAMGLNSSIPHLFKNLGTTPARGIWFVHHRHD
jgi:quercetin dioxygenase-like cupin family protein